MFQVKWIVLALAIIMYALVIIFQDKKVWFTSAAAIIIIALGITLPDAVFPLSDAARAAGGASARFYALGHSVGEIINWNVIMIYLGSMIIAALFIYSKVPARIADGIVNSSRNTGLAMIAILAMTGIISRWV